MNHRFQNRGTRWSCAIRKKIMPIQYEDSAIVNEPLPMYVAAAVPNKMSTCFEITKLAETCQSFKIMPSAARLLASPFLSSCKPNGLAICKAKTEVRNEQIAILTRWSICFEFLPDTNMMPPQDVFNRETLSLGLKILSWQFRGSKPGVTGWLQLYTRSVDRRARLLRYYLKSCNIEAYQGCLLDIHQSCRYFFGASDWRRQIARNAAAIMPWVENSRKLCRSHALRAHPAFAKICRISPFRHGNYKRARQTTFWLFCTYFAHFASAENMPSSLIAMLAWIISHQSDLLVFPGKRRRAPRPQGMRRVRYKENGAAWWKSRR